MDKKPPNNKLFKLGKEGKGGKDQKQTKDGKNDQKQFSNHQDQLNKNINPSTSPIKKMKIEEPQKQQQKIQLMQKQMNKFSQKQEVAFNIKSLVNIQNTLTLKLTQITIQADEIKNAMTQAEILYNEQLKKLQVFQSLQDQEEKHQLLKENVSQLTSKYNQICAKNKILEEKLSLFDLVITKKKEYFSLRTQEMDKLQKQQKDLETMKMDLTMRIQQRNNHNMILKGQIRVQQSILDNIIDQNKTLEDKKSFLEINISQKQILLAKIKEIIIEYQEKRQKTIVEILFQKKKIEESKQQLIRENSEFLTIKSSMLELLNQQKEIFLSLCQKQEEKAKLKETISGHELHLTKTNSQIEQLLKEEQQNQQKQNQSLEILKSKKKLVKNQQEIKHFINKLYKQSENISSELNNLKKQKNTLENLIEEKQISKKQLIEQKQLYQQKQLALMLELSDLKSEVKTFQTSIEDLQSKKYTSQLQKMDEEDIYFEEMMKKTKESSHLNKSSTQIQELELKNKKLSEEKANAERMMQKYKEMSQVMSKFYKIPTKDSNEMSSLEKEDSQAF